MATQLESRYSFYHPTDGRSLVRTNFASRGFSIAVPTVCNSLPSSIHDSSSMHTFRCLLKTHCFQQAFSSPSVSPKYLRFGYWPTLCNAHYKYSFTYYFTYILGSLGYKFRDPSLPRFDTIPVCDRRTDGILDRS